MASDLLPRPSFGENLSENVVGSKAAQGNEKCGSQNIWKADQGHDYYINKEGPAYFANTDNNIWCHRHAEDLEGDWFSHEKMFMPLVPSEKWKIDEILKGDNFDEPGLGQRGFCREPRVDFKAAFASVTEWLDDLAVESEEFEGIAIKERQVDTKYWLAGLWEIGHSNVENIRASGGKPGNIVRRDNLLFAEWGNSNLFWQRSKDHVENPTNLECKDYTANVNSTVPEDKANHENQKVLSFPWNAVDAMLEFHAPENHKEQFKEHDQGFETKLGSHLNRMSGRTGDMACEVVPTEKGVFSLGEEESDILSIIPEDGQEFEHIVNMGTVLERTKIVPKPINPYTGFLQFVEDKNLIHIHQRCMEIDFEEPLECTPSMVFTGPNENDQVNKQIEGVSQNCSNQDSRGGGSVSHNCSNEDSCGGGSVSHNCGNEDSCGGGSVSHNGSNEDSGGGSVSHNCNNEDSCGGGSPHEALSFALHYLSLQDLLSVERVCKSLRAAVKDDALLWRHLHVEHSLSKRLTNNALIQLSVRSQGHLQCLSLVECQRITDDGLKLVLDSNPHLMKLCLPGCTRVSAEGIVQMVKGHAEKNRNGTAGLKHLRIRGLYGLTKEHLDNLKSSLHNGSQQRSESLKPQFYHNGHYSFSYDDDRAIDVEVCPKCENARLVYDCTRERCQQRKENKLQQCRGCIFCIARCEECGRCIDDNEYEETFCLDLLCSSCWLQLPKCLECNRPGCGRHADHFMRKPDTTFVCGDCMGVSACSLGPEFHSFD